MNLRSLLALLLFLACTDVGSAQEKHKPPHINTATIYAHEPNWPQKPAGYHWGAVPGVAVDAKDEVYVFTRAQPPVQVYDTAGKLLRAWGKGIDKAHHIRIDADGHVWIADIGNHVVEKYTRDGKLLLTIGTKGTAGRDKTHFNMPTDMAVTPEGDVFVSDGYGNARIVHFDKNGKFVHEWGELGAGPGQLSIPHAIVRDAKGRLYVADRNNVRVQVFDGKGKLLDSWSNLVVPWGLTLSKDNEICVVGSSPMHWGPKELGVPPVDQLFMRFTPEGKMVQLFRLPKGVDGLERPGEVNWVHAVALDSQGNLYVGDIQGRKAQKFRVISPTGK